MEINKYVQVDDQTGHHLVSSTPLHGTNSTKTNFTVWPSPILSQLPEQQKEPRKCNTKPKNKDLRKNERDNIASKGRERVLQTNSTTVIHNAASSASDEDILVMRQNVGSSMFQKYTRPDPGDK
jgi:hypothetical protein